MADTNRFPGGTLLSTSAADARPVGTLIRDSADGIFKVSTNAAVAAFTALFGLTSGITANEIADPGTGVAIPVTASGFIDLAIGAGAETNTLAIPTNVGQFIFIQAGTVGGGTRAITCAQAINVAGNTIMTFDAVSDWIALIGTKVNTALRWRVLNNANVALS